MSIDSYENSFRPFGSRYEGATLAQVRLPNEQIEEIYTWLKTGKNMLIFLGNPGIGKTYLCAAMYNFVRTQIGPHVCRYWNERQLLTRLRQGMDGKGDYLKNLHELCEDKMVILDDLGSSGINEWRAEVMFEFIDYRYESTRPTLITSNLSRAEIKEKLGSRFASRMFAKENTIIEVEGADLRQESL